MTQNQGYGLAAEDKIEMTQNQGYGLGAEDKIEMTQNQGYGAFQTEQRPQQDQTGMYEVVDEKSSPKDQLELTYDYIPNI